MTHPLPDKWPHTIREINDLTDDQKCAIYKTLIPDWIYDQFGIDRETLTINAKSVIKLRCPHGSRAMEMSVFHQPGSRDPALYLNMADSFLGQLMVLLVMMNDPDSPRYNVDIDELGHPTNLGTSSRNHYEEVRAFEAGLAPGQIRSGLRGFRRAVPVFEEFVGRMGHDLFLIEPLSYHNAITFERYGFGYTVGRQEMENIHTQFMPGGSLHQRLDNRNLFRREDAWQSIRGRAWAIHDGILGHPFTGFHMYKRINHHAGVNTFPNGVW